MSIATESGDKTTEHSIFLVFFNSISRIRDIEIEKIGIFQMITKSDASTGGKLHSVIHHIGYHLCQPVLLNVYKTIRQTWSIS